MKKNERMTMGVIGWYFLITFLLYITILYTTEKNSFFNSPCFVVPAILLNIVGITLAHYVDKLIEKRRNKK